MTSDNNSNKAIRLICLMSLGIAFYSCNKVIPGDWPPFEFSEKVFLVGPDGGHYEATVLNYEVIDVDYITDGVSHKKIRWDRNNTISLQMDELTVSHRKYGNTIEIDVAHSDTLNEWWIGVSNVNISDNIHIIQNGE